MAALLELTNITKRYPGVTANDRISFSVQPGEVIGLLGENGAGKSTLMNILYGLTPPDEGLIHWRGEPVRLQSPAAAIALGIGMVHQHFMLIPVMTVSENLVLGHESVWGPGFLDRAAIRRRVLEISSAYHLEVDPDAVAGELPVGVQQRVEILKALYRKAAVLILDEPTAVLTPQEIESLFQIVRRLREQGEAVIFITHKLKEALHIADRIIVLRQGQKVCEAPAAELTTDQLTTMMVGRNVVTACEREASAGGGEMIRVRDVWWRDRRGAAALKGVNLSVRAGEIVGIAGVQGNGQTELVYALTGMLQPTAGAITIDGKEMTAGDPAAFYQAGVGHIPEDRLRDGLVKSYSITENLMLKSYRREFCRFGFMLNRAAARGAAVKLAAQFDVRAPSVETTAGALSGGNQQKVIAAREMSRPLKVLIAAQPTRGLDIGSIEFIHRQILEQRCRGCAVVLVSSELDEILTLSDRIGVMAAGSLVTMVDNVNLDRTEIGKWMGGERVEDVR